MSVPKEVILDLLPVYLAGEASPATRAWLEQQLSQDAELAERLRTHRLLSPNQGTQLPSPPSVPPELALRALQRTRRLMTRLRWLFGLGMAFTASAFSLEFSVSPVKIRLLIFDYPEPLGVSLLIGIACWIAYFQLRRRLRIPG